MIDINYRSFLFFFIVFSVVTLNDSDLDNQRKMCEGLVSAAHYCSEVKPLLNAEKRLALHNKSYYGNGTETQKPCQEKKKNRFYDHVQYVTQNKNFLMQNKELKGTIAQLHNIVQILEENTAKIISVINHEKGQLEEQNKLLETERTELNNEMEKKESYMKDLEEKINGLEQQLSDCQEQNKPTEMSSECSNLATGVYNIKIKNCTTSMTVRCNNDIHNGGWIVILRRFNGSENFFRNWNECREGFGNRNGEFFIGLENLHCITNSKRYELYVEYEYFDTMKGRAIFDNFRVGQMQSSYTLESLGRFQGTTENEMKTNNLHQKFSTYDIDNDKLRDTHCAKEFKGAWWFNSCEGPNPFGRYSKNEKVTEFDSMSWDGLQPIKSIQMLIRTKQ